MASVEGVCWVLGEMSVLVLEIVSSFALCAGGTMPGLDPGLAGWKELLQAVRDT